MSTAKIVRANEGKWLDVSPEEAMVFKLTDDDTDGAVDFIESRVGYLSGPPLHIHQKQSEIVYILEGSLRFQVGEEMLDVAAGEVVYLPKGVPHTFTNLSQQPARAVGVVWPGGLHRFMEDWGTLMATSPGPEQMAGLAAHYHQAVVGPPLAVVLRQRSGHLSAK
jgi:mannose-6-phosphate isomerase-like protein (cupin superfamily)